MQMCLDLTLGFGQKSQTPSIAGQSRDDADREGVEIPQRVQYALASAQLCKTLLGPGQMLRLFFGSTLEQGFHTTILRYRHLAAIERLRAHLTRMVHAHELRRETLFIFTKLSCKGLARQRL